MRDVYDHIIVCICSMIVTSIIILLININLKLGQIIQLLEQAKQIAN